jgi:uncharacterized protein YyaL (SSP411 family)
MSNRLANSTSPYLLQHQDNPVEWYEWGDEPFAVARDADLPVLLSVGYSACHWCHVMAHESFEDDATARFMNEQFVNIKVDREERPDIDRIYMDALQAMTGQGGWPMTVFLTPDGEPFFAGTYFPKQPRGHMPSFLQVLARVAEAWQQRRDQVSGQAARLTAAIRRGLPTLKPPPVEDAAARAVEMLQANHDAEWGGFGSSPKFPQPPVLEFLLRHWTLRPDSRNTIEPILRRTFDAMRAGGIYDQIGGGFARYSVDERWLIPHFEKMLYDNASLARIYLRAGQALGEPRYTVTARETLDYLADEMRDPGGGIHAAEDADSEGVEGKYYVWSYAEFNEVVGDDGPVLVDVYGVSREGNFEGANNLHLAAHPAVVAEHHGLTVDEVKAAKARGDRALRAARQQRIRPGRDDKVIASWNGLALRAFAEAGAVLESHRYCEVAEGIATFVMTEMVGPDGRLMRSWRSGRLSGPGFCDDYAAMAVGLLSLYQVTGNPRWFEDARKLVAEMIRLFGDRDGMFTPGIDTGNLIARPKDFADNPSPSANSLAAESLQVLSALTGETDDHLAGIMRGAGVLLERHPTAVAHLLGVLLTENAGLSQIAIVGQREARRDLARVVWERYRPGCVVASGDGVVPLLEGRGTAGADAAAHVCRDFVCDLPVSTATDLRARLDR